MSSNSASLGHSIGSASIHLGTTADQSSTPPPASPIDLSTLLHRCLGDGAFCGMILHKFAARSADQVAALERALQSANMIELSRQAHTLQGVAANMSAAALRAQAKELEDAAQCGDLAAAGTLINSTREEVARCVAAVPALLESVSSGG